jgi:hypothetical protein
VFENHSLYLKRKGSKLCDKKEQKARLGWCSCMGLGPGGCETGRGPLEVELPEACWLPLFKPDNRVPKTQRRSRGSELGLA